jgi:hypothetical protein
MSQTQALARNIFNDSTKLTVPEYGDVFLRIYPEGLVRVATNDAVGLLYEGMRYSFTAQFTESGGTWLIQAESLSFKMPAKGKKAALAAVTSVVNAMLAEHGNLSERIERQKLQQERERIIHETSRTEERLSYAEQTFTSYRTRLENLRQQLATFDAEHPEITGEVEGE